MAPVIARLNSCAHSGLSPHPYIQCQILLVQFMVEVIDDSSDPEVVENLCVFEEKCERGEDLVQAFSRWVCSVQPHVLERMGCDYRQTVITETIVNWATFHQSSRREIRPLYFSVFVLDLIVRTSTLSDFRKTEWSTRVLMNWLESLEGPATNVLNRAEAFFADLEPALVHSLVSQLVVHSSVRSLCACTSQNPYTQNPYTLHPLRTGLGKPATHQVAFCKVVVLRPDLKQNAQKEAQKETFIVRFSQHELVPGTNNSGLWNAITARVPFAQWEKMESYSKIEKHHHEGPRRDRCGITPWCWPDVRMWLPPPDNVVATEERAQDMIYDVQYQLYLGCMLPDDEYAVYTVVIYARA